MTPFEVLGVPEDASPAVVRRAYLRLARLHHPDFHAGRTDDEVAAASRRMQEINQAWAAVRERAGRAEPDLGFRPFEPDAYDDDTVDPLDEPDAAYHPGRPISALERATVMVPVALFAAACGVGSLALVLDAVALIGFAVILFVLSCAGFLIVPLLALGRASRDDR